MKCWCIAAAPLFFNLGRPLSPTMAPRIAIAFLALLAFLSCSETYAQTDYMFLNLGWPGGLCPQQGDCCFPSTWTKKDDFVVRFLARNFDRSINCSKIPFDPKALQNIIRSLNQNWPSFSCMLNDNNMVAWEQTWKDNGPCTWLTVSDYFSRALALRDKANLLYLLSRRGIRPSHTNKYLTVDVVNAINQGLGVNTAVLHCGSVMLERIMNVRLCVDITATKFITCPTPRSSTCPASVKLDVLPNSTDTLEVEDNPIEMVVAQ